MKEIDAKAIKNFLGRHTLEFILLAMIIYCFFFALLIAAFQHAFIQHK